MRRKGTNSQGTAAMGSADGKSSATVGPETLQRVGVKTNAAGENEGRGDVAVGIDRQGTDSQGIDSPGTEGVQLSRSGSHSRVGLCGRRGGIASRWNQPAARERTRATRAERREEQEGIPHENHTLTLLQRFTRSDKLIAEQQIQNKDKHATLSTPPT